VIISITLNNLDSLPKESQKPNRFSRYGLLIAYHDYDSPIYVSLAYANKNPTAVGSTVSICAVCFRGIILFENIASTETKKFSNLLNQSRY